MSKITRPGVPPDSLHQQIACGTIEIRNKTISEVENTLRKIYSNLTWEESGVSDRESAKLTHRRIVELGPKKIAVNIITVLSFEKTNFLLSHLAL